MSDTTKVVLESDEYYPAYFIPTSPSQYQQDGFTYEVDPDTLRRWRKAMKDYDTAQGEIHAFVRSHWKNGKRIK